MGASQCRRNVFATPRLMNRPQEERQIAPEWIKASQTLSPEHLLDQSKFVITAIQE